MTYKTNTAFHNVCSLTSVRRRKTALVVRILVGGSITTLTAARTRGSQRHRTQRRPSPSTAGGRRHTGYTPFATPRAHRPVSPPEGPNCGRPSLPGGNTRDRTDHTGPHRIARTTPDHTGPHCRLAFGVRLARAAVLRPVSGQSLLPERERDGESPARPGAAPAVSAGR